MNDDDHSRRGNYARTLVGEQVSSSAYDEVFLNCTAGYCIFDADQKLQAFSADFPDLYPTFSDKIGIGVTYEEYMRQFFENSCVQNMGPAKDVDEWLEGSMLLFEQSSAQHIHHLLDGRWMQIDMKKTSTGHVVFIALDITEFRMSQIALEESHERYRNFAHLATDWFWELDENLCYSYHSVHRSPNHEASSESLLGMSRIDTLAESAVKSKALECHTQELHDHKFTDAIIEIKNSNGTTRFVNIIGQPIFDKNNVFTGYLGCSREVTKDIELQSQLSHLAQHDDMTGLMNRRAFETTLAELIEQAERKDIQASLCFIDLDRFKLVNDGGGHDAGDRLLMNIATTFCELLGKGATVARLGGDEFGVILHKDVNSALQEINGLIRHISSTPFEWKQRKYTIGASAGLVAIENNTTDMSELMSQADTACYTAKNGGRNQAQIYMYDEFFQDPVSLELKQVNLLRHAMDNNGLMLFLQPIKALQKESNDKHFEVLLRLNENGEIKSAGEFIPVAEKYDLMQHIDLWVLNESLAILANMEEKGIDISLSVNLSGNTLSNKDSISVFTDCIEKSNVSAQRLCFEITETVAIKNIAVAQNFISQIKQLGCSFSLDDFGSGLSSFGYLKDMSVDYLKIDGSFVQNLVSDMTCKAIVGAFNQLSHELGMQTIAEFVEDPETEALLKELGIDFAQGYGVGKPELVADWTHFMLIDHQPHKKAG